MSLMEPELAASIVRYAGGEIVGQTQLHKTAYLLKVTGLLSENVNFVYKHFGPYSRGIASSARLGALFGNLIEKECQTDWGGTYSIYSVDDPMDDDTADARSELATLAAAEDTIVLELATIAVFLKLDGYDNPWEEIKRRKPTKITKGRLERAKALLAELKKVRVPEPLPDIV